MLSSSGDPSRCSVKQGASLLLKLLFRSLGSKHGAFLVNELAQREDG